MGSLQYFLRKRLTNPSVHQMFPSRYDCVLWLLSGFSRQPYIKPRQVLKDVLSSLPADLLTCSPALTAVDQRSSNSALPQRVTAAYQPDVLSPIPTPAVPSWLFRQCSISFSRWTSKESIPSTTLCLPLTKLYSPLQVHPNLTAQEFRAQAHSWFACPLACSPLDMGDRCCPGWAFGQGGHHQELGGKVASCKSFCLGSQGKMDHMLCSAAGRLLT